MLKLVLFATLLVYVYASGVEQAVVCLKKGEIDGKVTFKKTADGIKVEGTINGLPAGKHGFHIHEKGDLGDNCKAAGGHFNPTKKNHGAPEDADRHVGDLGNIVADDKKVANVNIIDKIIALDGENSIIGRALVIHEGEDDLGKGGFEDSNTTGHAGARLVCGVVGIVNETMLGEELCPGGVPDVAVSTTGSYFLLFTTVYLTIQYYFN